jgi:hypothetical protein
MGINKMDKIIVPSNHAKEVFENTSYTGKHKQTNQDVKIECDVDIDVLFEGIDRNT